MIYLGLILLCSVLCGSFSKDIIVPKHPPDPSQAALMARYIIHNTAWVSVATISTQEKIQGYPFVSLESMSDGTMSNSTGVPYLYLTPLDVAAQDVERNNSVTIMATLAETDYCGTENFDPQDPRCARVMISGHLLRVKESSAEYTFGKEALFDKHPSMKTWPLDHKFYVAKVDIENIGVLDYFGGVKNVTVQDYFNANITNLINIDMHFKGVSVIEIDSF